MPSQSKNQPGFDLEVAFDDSGTDANTPVAVAACYIASKEQWRELARNWDEVAKAEGFEVFHMSDFIAKKEAGRKPFCDWDNPKKDRVYGKLASIINTRVRKGFAIAVPKKPFDEHVFPEFKEQYAADHYTFAVKSVIGLLEEWRTDLKVTAPMRYVFDRGSLAEKQLKEIWEEAERRDSEKHKYGFAPNGVMFQDKALFKALQAADILAWQVQNNLRRTVLLGHNADDPRYAHPGFMMLRKNRPMAMGFYSADQMRKVFDFTKASKQETGKWPWEKHPIGARVKMTTPGTIY